jgi:NAD(P)-dependent dehydrogenase (short-subunit alcohol dehydrogenase family)
MAMQTPDRRVAIVTGGNKGIGFAIARGLGEFGDHVLVGCRNGARGETAAASLRAEGFVVDALPLDVTDDASITAAASLVEARFGRLDVLVNNAGVALDRQAGALPLSRIMRDTFAVNVIGVACMIEAFMPLLARSKAGRIVNLSSGLGSLALNSDPASEYAAFKFPAYNSSKAAVNMLTIVYAARLSDQGIKVNAVDPGYTATDLNAHRGTRTPAQAAAIAIRLASLDDAGPTGGFFDEAGTVAW